MAELFANNSQSNLNGGILSGDTTLTVLDPSSFPGTGTFRIVVQAADGSNREYMTVTGVSGSVFTVTRHQEGTSAVAHADGEIVAGVLTVAGLLAKLAEVTTPPSGAVGSVQYNNSGVFGGSTIWGFSSGQFITAAGSAGSMTATAPAQITTAQAGVGLAFTASDAVAGSGTAGAAAGGGFTFTCGDAKRLTSGDANGGGLRVELGGGIGTGVGGVFAVMTNGGTPGTDELQAYHDGTDGYLFSKKGSILLCGNTTTGKLIFAPKGTFGSQDFLVMTINNAYRFSRGDGVTMMDLTNNQGVTQIYSTLTILDGNVNNSVNLKAGDANNILTLAAGSWYKDPSGTKYLTADVSRTTTAFTNLSDLSVTLLAGRKYTGRLMLPINGVTAADGFKLDLNGGGASATYLHYGFAAAMGCTVGTRTSTALATAINLTALPDANDLWLEIPIMVICNAGGTFIPRFAKDSDAAGATTKCLKGGYLQLRDS